MTNFISSHFLLLLVLGTLLSLSSSSFLLLVVEAENSQEYLALCKEIIALGKRASSYGNAGDLNAAYSTIEEARQVFEKAKALEPENPQAYADIGILYLNTNQLNESIDALSAALEKVPEAKDRASFNEQNAKVRAHLSRQINFAKYGYASKNRDEVYKGGKGDVGKAYEWSLRQLEFTPNPHRTHHEAGTLAVVLCEYDDEMCNKTDDHLRFASATAFDRYKALRMAGPADLIKYQQEQLLLKQQQQQPSSSSKKVNLQQQQEQAKEMNQDQKFKCMKSNLRVGAWYGAHPKVKSQTVLESIYIHEIAGTQVMLNGPDGVITFLQKDGDCTVLSPASDHYLDLARNLMVAPPPRPGVPPQQQEFIVGPQRQIQKGKLVFSTIQYHSTNFYHWLCEVIPRMVIASLFWDKWKEASILVPKVKAGESMFISESISMLFDDKVRLIEYEPFMQTSHLAYVHWDQPDCPHKVGRPCHALAKPLALHYARNEMVRAIRRSPWASITYKEPVVVLAMRGQGVQMRKFREIDFLNKLERRVMREAKGVVIAHESSKMVFGLAMANYYHADVVVGVHGGALSNIMACRPGTGVVEVGFQTAAARHYSHVAHALSLDYQFIQVDEDLPLKRGVGAPDISFDQDHVIDSVLNALKQALETKKKYTLEFDQDTDPRVDPREAMEEQKRLDAEAEAYFNSAKGAPSSSSKSASPARDGVSLGDEEFEYHGGTAEDFNKQEQEAERQREAENAKKKAVEDHERKQEEIKEGNFFKREKRWDATEEQVGDTRAFDSKQEFFVRDL